MRQVIRLIVMVVLMLLTLGISGPGKSQDESISRTETVRGLNGQVDILRDSYGIPTIRAGDNHDLFFGLGYAMASDRLWQMDGSRRLAEGRIAEVTGNDQLHWDTYHRTLGLGRIANQMVDKLDPTTRGYMQAFADGVNAYIGQCATLPFEFIIMGYRPEPWQVSDSLAVQRLVSVWLAADAWDEEMHQVLIDSEGEQVANLLFMPVPENEPDYTGGAGQSDAGQCEKNVPCFTSGTGSLKSLSAVDGWRHELVSRWLKPLADLSEAGHMEASNIWAVDGSMTESGEPILAMDPHLNYWAPSILYEARLEGGDFRCWGATFPGMPAFPFGANEKICWGASNLPADSQDLYIERVNPSDPMQYEYAGSWAQFDVIRERIPSKNASGVVEDYDLDVLVSRHGPIVERGADGLEALRWTGSEPTDDVSSFFKAMRADSMDAFYEAFRDYSCPPENFCVAEAGRNGRVGQILVGKIPIRKGYSGASPVDGSDPAYDWVGYIPYDSLPQRLDPPEGFVAHANNLPRGALDPNRLPVGFSFSANYRVERIIERLVHDKPLTAEKMRQIQMDDVDTTGRVFVPAILGAWDRVGTDYPGLADQVERLRGWDYRLNETSVAATLYQVWIIEFGKLCVMNHLSASAGSYIGYPDRWLPILQDYLAGTSILPWLASDDQGARDRAVLDALASTVVRLQTEVGPDPESWAWGQVHYAIFPHPSGMATLIGAGSYPWGGGRHTIRVGHYDFASMLPFQNDFGSVFRAVIASIDGKWTITAVLPPGEAGSVLSPHFKDEMDLWLTGEQRPVPFPTGTFEPTYSVSLEPAE